MRKEIIKADRPPEKEHNPKISPEFVQGVEKAKISNQDKVNLLLVKAGLKPASDITLDIKTLFYRDDGSLVEGRQHFSDQEIARKLIRKKCSHSAKS